MINKIELEFLEYKTYSFVRYGHRLTLYHHRSCLRLAFPSITLLRLPWWNSPYRLHITPIRQFYGFFSSAALLLTTLFALHRLHWGHPFRPRYRNAQRTHGNLDATDLQSTRKAQQWWHRCSDRPIPIVWTSPLVSLCRLCLAHSWPSKKQPQVLLGRWWSSRRSSRAFTPPLFH